METTTPPPPVLVPEVAPEVYSQSQDKYPVTPKKGNKFLKFLLFLVIIAILGWIGLSLWQMFDLAPVQIPQPSFLNKPTPTSQAAADSATSEDLYSGWISQAVAAGISFRLPPGVEPISCDSPGCISRGTYLPGGTRFTVALRGKGFALRDFRGSLISDTSGRVFDSQKTFVTGRPAIEFKGQFVGGTVGGYTFSQMRGMMIEVTDILGLEVNHFSPAGDVVDFVADEIFFDKILSSFEFNLPTGGEKGGI